MSRGVADADGRVAQRPGRLAITALVVAWAAILARALALASTRDLRLGYIAGMTAFLAIELVVLVWPPRPTPLVHVVFTLQAGLVLVLLSLAPDNDFVTTLLALECYQTAVVLSGRARLAWAVVLVALIGVSLMLERGALSGLALALVPMAAGVVLSTFVAVDADLECARATSERMVADLRAAQKRLQEYAAQVDELAAIEQRSRLARELQESVSSTLTDALAAGASARRMLDEPAAAAPSIERLQALTQQALAQMRAIIEELRPPGAESRSSGAEEQGTGTKAIHPPAATG